MKVQYSTHPGYPEVYKDIPLTTWFDMWCEYPAIKSCDWYKSMPKETKYQGLNRAVARIRDIMDNQSDHTLFSTVRQCPNIKDVMINSLLVKAPCDIDCAVADQGMLEDEPQPWLLYTPSDFNMPTMAPHSRTQFTCERSPLFKDHFNLKIDTQLVLRCPDGVEPSFAQPIYHNPNAPWKVLQGQFTKPLNKHVRLIFNAMVHESVREFSIKKGDALMYLFFGKKVDMEPVASVGNSLFRDRFGRRPTTTEGL